MTNAPQATSTKKTQSEPEFVWPEYTPSPAHRNFLERLKRARIERGLSIADISGEVGLTFRLANEFENGVTPLPFEWLEVWCQVVGVPFSDYLAIYWADEREWAEQREAQERQDAREREDARKEAEQKALCIVNTETPAPETPALSPPHRGLGLLNLLRFAVAHIKSRLRSLSSTPKKTPK